MYDLGASASTAALLIKELLIRVDLERCLTDASDAFRLALVLVDIGFTQRLRYVRRSFDRGLGFSKTTVVFNIARRLGGQRATDD